MIFDSKVDDILEGLREPSWEVKKKVPVTIKEYLDEAERLQGEAYALMLRKFPVGSWVEWYHGSFLMKAKVFYHSPTTCTLRVQREGRKYLTWIRATLCEPENPVEVRTVHSGSNACKIRLRKQKEEGNAGTES